MGEETVLVVVDVHVEDAGAARAGDDLGACGEFRAGDALAGLQERRGGVHADGAEPEGVDRGGEREIGEREERAAHDDVHAVEMAVGRGQDSFAGAFFEAGDDHAVFLGEMVVVVEEFENAVVHVHCLLVEMRVIYLNAKTAKIKSFSENTRKKRKTGCIPSFVD